MSNNFKFVNILGAWNIDGKSETILDRFTHDNPKFGNADETCDSYHKYKDDVKVLKFLNVSQYKFSIAWSRILPHGKYYGHQVREFQEQN